MTIEEWAQRWNLPLQALDELRQIHLQEYFHQPAYGDAMSEEAVASRVNLDASYLGMVLLRNNSGAFKNEYDQWVRFGLGNISEKFNRENKSSDYIGFFPLYILPHHVGRTIAVFSAVETKRHGWKFTGNKEENAQAKFLDVVTANGGFGTFASSSEQFVRAFKGFNHVGKIDK